MAEESVITLMLDDLSKMQPITTALCLGQDLSEIAPKLAWQYFNVSEFLNLPFQQRHDVALVILTSPEMQQYTVQQKSQLLVKLRDLMAKRIVVVAALSDEKLLRALGFTQLIDKTSHAHDFALWQFNILTYKHVPDWLNAKFWANPENWDKFRW